MAVVIITLFEPDPAVRAVSLDVTGILQVWVYGMA